MTKLTITLSFQTEPEVTKSFPTIVVQQEYIAYECKHCSNYYAAYCAAITEADRKATRIALAKARLAAYARWTANIHHVADPQNVA